MASSWGLSWLRSWGGSWGPVGDPQRGPYGFVSRGEITDTRPRWRPKWQRDREELEEALAAIAKPARRAVRKAARDIAERAESPEAAIQSVAPLVRHDAGQWLELIRAAFFACRVTFKPAYLPLVADLVAAELERKAAELAELRMLVHLDAKRRADEEALILLMVSV